MVGKNRGNILTPLPTEADHCVKAGFYYSFHLKYMYTKHRLLPSPQEPCFMTIYEIRSHEREVKSFSDSVSVSSLLSDIRTLAGEMECFSIICAFLKFSQKLHVPTISSALPPKKYLDILGTLGKPYTHTCTECSAW